MELFIATFFGLQTILFPFEGVEVKVEGKSYIPVIEEKVEYKKIYYKKPIEVKPVEEVLPIDEGTDICDKDGFCEYPN